MRWLGFGCWTAGTLADDGYLMDLARRLDAVARPHGALASVSVALLHLAMGSLAQVFGLFLANDPTKGQRPKT